MQPWWCPDIEHVQLAKFHQFAFLICLNISNFVAALTLVRNKYYIFPFLSFNTFRHMYLNMFVIFLLFLKCASEGWRGVGKGRMGRVMGWFVLWRRGWDVKLVWLKGTRVPLGRRRWGVRVVQMGGTWSLGCQLQMATLRIGGCNSFVHTMEANGMQIGHFSALKKFHLKSSAKYIVRFYYLPLRSFIDKQRNGK